MINEILWYIWIVGRAYLGIGLVISIIFSYLALTSNGNLSFSFKEFIFTTLLHPVVVYHFIKEWEYYDKRN